MYNKIDLREVPAERLKEISLDLVDIDVKAPEFEPNRQFYFMAKARDYVKRKSAELGRPMTFFTQTFGWANVSIRSDGELIEDWQEDIVEPEDLEQAAYEFVQLYREGGEMHERGGVATLVESVVFTEEKQRAMGIPEGTLPVGWWIGFKVLDADVWEKVKDGTYSMFSIEGEAERVEVENEDTD